MAGTSHILLVLEFLPKDSNNVGHVVTGYLFILGRRMMQSFEQPFNHKRVFSGQLVCHMTPNFRKYWQFPANSSVLMLQPRFSLYPCILNCLSKWMYLVLIIRINLETWWVCQWYQVINNNKSIKIYVDLSSLINSLLWISQRQHFILCLLHLTMLSSLNQNVLHHLEWADKFATHSLLFDKIIRLSFVGIFAPQYLSA